jgi:hypothetical protein
MTSITVFVSLLSPVTRAAEPVDTHCCLGCQVFYDVLTTTNQGSSSWEEVVIKQVGNHWMQLHPVACTLHVPWSPCQPPLLPMPLL